uniref:Hypothetical protein yk1067a12 n=1 Tax=Caenorhabditis elegans TaxID=6239 RepID=UPI0000481B7B|nr:Chain A, Hypothetical protein yk1067a12 [Caenorhabditis elegans]
GSSGSSGVKFLTVNDDILSMPQARNFCASAGGYLADDLGDDKNNFYSSIAANTQFWIGLFKNSDGQFYWDRGQGINPDLLNQPITYWANGEPSNDPTRQCVYFDGRSGDKSKVWTTDTCATPRPFICQKHRYDSDHKPNTIGDASGPSSG